MKEFSKESKLGFIGAGAVGGSLAVKLAMEGYPVIATASRTFASAQGLADRIPGCEAYSTLQEAADLCDVVFITTIDDAIAPVASSIRWRSGQGVVHSSGAASLDVFDEPVKQGAVPGAFHPIQAFSSVETGVDNIPGTTFGIEGGEEMQRYLSGMARDIGGNPIFLKAEDKVLYHLSAVMMGNLLTCLVGVSAQIWEQFGYTRADGVKALVPMMRAVANNLEASGIPTAVTGPYPRGDVGTIRKHLEALTNSVPDVFHLYREMALSGLPLAVEKGALSPEKAEEISELIEEYTLKQKASAGPHS